MVLLLQIGPVLVLVQEERAGRRDATTGRSAAAVAPATVHLRLLLRGHVRWITKLEAVARADEDPV